MWLRTCWCGGSRKFIIRIASDTRSESGTHELPMNAKVCCEGSWKVVHLPSAHEFHIRLATCAVGFHAFLFCTGVQSE